LERKKNQKEKCNQIKDFNFNQNIIPLAKLQNNDLAKSLSRAFTTTNIVSG
jgi:hypothetical protein